MKHIKHIVCFGDSNTHGYCAERGQRYDEAERWTQLLDRQLGEEYLIIEEGLSGRTTCFQDPIHEGRSGLDYIYPCLMSHEPVDLLVVMLGTNDTKERFGSSSDCIGLGLKRLLTRAITATECWRDGNANILIIVPKDIDKRYEQTEVINTMGRECAEKSAGLASSYLKIATLLGCNYLDANTVVTEQNSIDYMHLTKKGHQELADALTALIPNLFKN